MLASETRISLFYSLHFVYFIYARCVIKLMRVSRKCVAGRQHNSSELHICNSSPRKRLSCSLKRAPRVGAVRNWMVVSWGFKTIGQRVGSKFLKRLSRTTSVFCSGTYQHWKNTQRGFFTCIMLLLKCFENNRIRLHDIRDSMWKLWRVPCNKCYSGWHMTPRGVDGWNF